LIVLQGYTYITWARLELNNIASFRTLLYTNSPKYTPITIPNNSDILGYWDSAFRSSGYDLSGETSVWVQYAVVGTNSSQKFYINGSEVGSQIAFGAGGTTHWGWGNNDVVPQPWGYVANMYFYNRQLSLSEIQQQYNFLSPRFVEPTPTPTSTSTPTVTPTNTITPTNTQTPTPSVTPNIVTSNLQLQLLPSSYVGSGTVWDTTVGSTDATLSMVESQVLMVLQTLQILNNTRLKYGLILQMVNQTQVKRNYWKNGIPASHLLDTLTQLDLMKVQVICSWQLTTGLTTLILL